MRGNTTRLSPGLFLRRNRDKQELQFECIDFAGRTIYKAVLLPISRNGVVSGGVDR
ncbi:MAG: hypothetical protein II943_11420 [Victivallales bacterium]|nr:hypothetical protein [Victivallales bacterium]